MTGPPAAARAPRLVLRADGGPGIGSGHLARCLALAQAWRDHHGEAELVSASVPAFWGDRYRDEGVALRSPEDGPLGAGADWVVLDGYHFGEHVQDEARRNGARLLVIDDHGYAGRSPGADAILDQNLGASAGAYADRATGCELLLGTRFALLRREFAAYRAWERHHPPVARRLLVALGGGRTAHLEVAVGEAVGALARLGVAPLLLESRADVPAAMAKADLALAPSGSICWELCFMGLPSVLLCTAANQRPLAEALDRVGAAESAAWHDELEPASLGALLAELAADVGRRARLSATARSLVDGQGAARVVAVLRGRLLRLRPAEVGDCRLLWEWANDPVVRAASLTSDPISWDEHVQWFQARLADPSCHLYLATRGPELLGQVRFQRDGDEAEISVSVSPGFRRQGWGPAVVDAGVRRLFRDSPATRVVARIRPTNEASIRTFAAACFDPDRSGGAGPAWLRLTRGRETERLPVGLSHGSPRGSHPPDRGDRLLRHRVHRAGDG